MPVDMRRYPKSWPSIRAAIMERAGHCCEQCGVRNYEVGYRTKDSTFVCLDEASSAGDRTFKESQWLANSMNTHGGGGLPRGRKAMVIVLTTAHIGAPHPDGRPGDKHDKQDCRPENLKALCQACHLRLDINEHMENAARTREARRLRAQPQLFAQPARQGE